jgi:hypothetical protein
MVACSVCVIYLIGDLLYRVVRDQEKLLGLAVL